MKKSASRGKKAALCTIISLLEEFTTVICGFILPRLILSAFGSKYNGLTSSISQFLACAVLLRAGIGGATRAALYKPLAENNKHEIDAIVKATDNFMKKIGLILLGSIVAFAVVYPFFVKNEFGWFFTFSLFLIIGASTFAESFFGITYLIVLQADQRLWVASSIKTICIILNTVIASCLILNGASIHIVKLGSAAVYVAFPIVLGWYVKKTYRIDKHVEPNNQAIIQRWDAFWQQVAVFVMNNTDVIVLTVFTNMLEVSVYSVYNMIVMGLKRLIVSFSNGIEAAFGNMIAKNEERVLHENLAVLETIMYAVCTIAYTCAGILIIDFVRVYTQGISDVNYLRPAFAAVMVTAQFFNGIRLPYQLIVQAAGHYKQTKKGAIVEPIINIILSVVFVFKFGLVGVAVGTLAATVFRTLQYSTYMSRNIIKRSWGLVLIRIAASAVEAATVIVIVRLIGLSQPEKYMAWFINAFITGLLCTAVVGAYTIVFFNKDTKLLIKKTKMILHRSKS